MCCERGRAVSVSLYSGRLLDVLLSCVAVLFQQLCNGASDLTSQRRLSGCGHSLSQHYSLHSSTRRSPHTHTAADERCLSTPHHTTAHSPSLDHRHKRLPPLPRSLRDQRTDRSAPLVRHCSDGRGLHAVIAILAPLATRPRSAAESPASTRHLCNRADRLSGHCRLTSSALRGVPLCGAPVVSARLS